MPDTPARIDPLIDELTYALEAFVDYYTQAGIGPCRAGQDDSPKHTDGFSGDERFNVRLGRKALANAAKRKAKVK